MGWKSTRTITRAEAIGLLLVDMARIPLMNNEELGDLMDMSYGDDIDKQYYGNNFFVVDSEDEIDRDNLSNY